MKGIMLCGAAYLIGSFPWCWIAVFLFARGPDGSRQDLRKIGTGNVGASNAMEFLGVGWYLPLILLDASKSYSSVWLVRDYYHCADSIAMVAAFMAVLGHCFPIYLKFKRGKGVSTAIGVLDAFHLFPEMGFAITVFLMGTVLSKRPSVGILIGTSAMCLWATRAHRSELWLLIFVTVLIWARFSDNIIRLLHGTELPYDIKRPRGKNIIH